MHAYELFVTLIYNFLIPAKAALYTQLKTTTTLRPSAARQTVTDNTNNKRSSARLSVSRT
jgi:hypothetical protein